MQSRSAEITPINPVMERRAEPAARAAWRALARGGVGHPPSRERLPRDLKPAPRRGSCAEHAIPLFSAIPLFRGRARHPLVLGHGYARGVHFQRGGISDIGRSG